MSESKDEVEYWTRVRNARVATSTQPSMKWSARRPTRVLACGHASTEYPVNHPGKIVSGFPRRSVTGQVSESRAARDAPR
jgi:hypothetical protein